MRRTVIALLICVCGLNIAIARPGSTGGALPNNSTDKLNQFSSTSTQSNESASEGEPAK